MKRLVSYIYKYENGSKGENIGFGKIDTEDNQIKMNISLRCKENKEHLEVYFFVREDVTRLVFVGDAVQKNGIYELKKIVNMRDLTEGKYGTSDIDGIIIKDNINIRFISFWKEEYTIRKCVKWNEIMVMDISGKTNNRNNIMEDSYEVIEEDTVYLVDRNCVPIEPIMNNENIGINGMEITGGEEKDNIREGRKVTESNIGKGNNHIKEDNMTKESSHIRESNMTKESSHIRESNMTEKSSCIKNDNMTVENNHIREDNTTGESSYISENNIAEKTNRIRKSDILEEDKNEKSRKGDINGDREKRSISYESLKNESDYMKALQEEAEKEKPEKTENNSNSNASVLERFFGKQRVKQYEIDRNRLSVCKIVPKDIYVLPRCCWNNVRNAYLCHCFMKYGGAYLIEADGLYIGVPGYKTINDEIMAGKYGFKHFMECEVECLGISSNMNWKRGFWCKKLMNKVGRTS